MSGYYLRVGINLKKMGIDGNIFLKYENLEKSYFSKQKVFEEFIPEDIDFNQSVLEIKDELNYILGENTYSENFLTQLTKHKNNLGELYKISEEQDEFICEHFPYRQILQYLRSICTLDIKHDPFKHEPLKGLFKLHFGISMYSTVRNVREFWFHNGIIKTKRRNSFNQIIDKYDNNIIAIQNQMHTVAINQKSKINKLKGEWIVYKIKNNKVHFLTLATHYESDFEIEKRTNANNRYEK